MTYSNADFTPGMKGYSDIKPFRFWCQKVLPLVYDDSLSYYELLCKVTDYINNIITDLAATEDNVGALLDAYNQLQDYVNDYFTNLDVQEEINNKLDDLVEDGTLTELIGNYIQPKIDEIQEELDNYETEMTANFNGLQSATESNLQQQNDKIFVLEGRMDTFSSLTQGSTTGDAELQDIRVAYDGKVYATAGNSVRGQAEKLYNYLSDIQTAYGANLFNKETLTYGKYVAADGTIADGAQYDLTDFIPVNGQFFVNIPHTGTVNSCWYSFYNSNKEFQQRTSYPQTAFTLNYTGYIRINLWNENNSDGHHNIDEIMINNGNTAKPYVPYYSALDRTARDAISTLQEGFLNRGVLPDNTDLNDVANSGIYLLNTSYTYSNTPLTDTAYLFHYNCVTTPAPIRLQIWLSYSGSVIYYRNQLNGTWSIWRPMLVKKQSKTAMIGDSITWGQLGGSPSGTQATITVPDWVNTLTSTDATNLAIGGMGWLTHQYHDQNAYEYIQTLNLSTYDYIYLAFGINDSDQSLGTYTDTSNDTIMGAIYNTINYIKTNYPSKVVIVVSPTLGTNYNSSFPEWNWISQRTGGWTLKTLTEEYEKFCNYYHIPFINLSQSPINSFNVTALTGGTTDIHLTQNGYNLLGKYIAGKLSAILG